MTPKRYSITQAANRLGIDRQIVEGAVREGELVQREFVARDRRIEEAPLLRWAAARGLETKQARTTFSITSLFASDIDGTPIVRCPVCSGKYVEIEHAVVATDRARGVAGGLVMKIHCGDGTGEDHESHVLFDDCSAGKTTYDLRIVKGGQR